MVKRKLRRDGAVCLSVCMSGGREGGCCRVSSGWLGGRLGGRPLAA